MVSLANLKQIVDASLDVADETAMAIQLDSLGEARQVRKQASRAMLQSLAPFSKLRLGGAVKVRAAILFVDMRSSTDRALEVGPRATYLTMHALLPALSQVVKESNGYIVGFRGDGLFAAFGIDAAGTPVQASQFGNAVGAACACGITMIEAVNKVVNPALEEHNVVGDVAVGVGVDAGEIVITRIGLTDGFEVTAYGDAVNSAAKLCSKGNNDLIVSESAEDLIPASPDGKLRSQYKFVKDKLVARVTSSATYLQ